MSTASELLAKLGSGASIHAGVDAEIVRYNATNTLCIQGHPEYVPTSRFAELTRELVSEMFAKSKEQELCAV